MQRKWRALLRGKKLANQEEKGSFFREESGKPQKQSPELFDEKKV